MNRARVVLVAALALLAGCMSVPLSTLWQMRSFGADDLAAMDPVQLRVATRIEPGQARVDPDRSNLTLTLHGKDGASDDVHAFGLRPARIQGGPILPPGEPGWHVLALDDAGRAAVQRLKPRLANVREHYSGATFNFNIKFAEDIPKSVAMVRFSVRLQLADAQDPFTLFDRARIPVEHAD